MRLVFLTANNAWVILFGEQTVAIGGTTFFTEREDAIREIGARGLVALADGTIVKQSEAPEPEEAPAVEEAPTEAPEAVEEAVEDPVDTIERELARDKEQPEQPKHRGRPATWSPEEAKNRKREQSKQSAARRSEERKKEVAERAAQWMRDNPDRATQYRERFNEKRRNRYNTDPEFRARVAESNRLYQQKRRAAKAAETQPEG